MNQLVIFPHFQWMSLHIDTMSADYSSMHTLRVDVVLIICYIHNNVKHVLRKHGMKSNPQHDMRTLKLYPPPPIFDEACIEKVPIVH